MTNGVLQATDVVKSYNKKEVLHSVSLTIEPGKIYGLIGRNGAGKTTLLSILTAQNTHDSGLVTYNGERVWENQKARRTCSSCRGVKRTCGRRSFGNDESSRICSEAGC